MSGAETHQLSRANDSVSCTHSLERDIVPPSDLPPVAYLLKEGGTQSISLCRLAASILLFAEKYNILLRPSYLPGRMNIEADALSRQQDQAEWMLHRNVAKKIFAHFGRPVVDLFASADTKQVHQYYTIDRHDPDALGTDAMHQRWDFNHQLLYAFPPPRLVPLVLVRVHQFQATLMTGSVATRADCTLHQTPSSPTIQQHDSTRGHLRFASCGARQTEDDAMARLSRSFQEAGLPSEVASFLRAAWKPSTCRQYSSAWRQWYAWCGREGLDPATPSLNNLLSYLWYLYSVKSSIGIQ